MRKLKCGACGGEFPMGEMFSLAERTLCKTCTEAETAGSDLRINDKPVPLIDPTLCCNCGADGGPDDLPLVGGAAMCPKCTDYFRHRPFPLWIKVAAVGLAVLALVGAWNSLRFLNAYFAMAAASRAFNDGDIETATSQASLAADLVPEAKGYQVDAQYFQGIWLLVNGKSAEAAATLRNLKAKVGKAPAFGLDHFLHLAESGAAFDRKDYDAFLKLSLEQATRTGSPDDLAAAASAFACKYAVTGDESFKAHAMEHLEKARQAAQQEKRDLGEYEVRILHRLKTREIITAEEYYRRFPPPDAKEAL
jgi:hypothetical protein